MRVLGVMLLFAEDFLRKNNSLYVFFVGCRVFVLWGIEAHFESYFFHKVSFFLIISCVFVEKTFFIKIL